MFALVSLLALLLVPSIIIAAVTPGGRANSCSFGYNNVYYIIGGTINNGTNFVSTPLPLNEYGTTLWTALPDPPQWSNVTSVATAPQFYCSVNYDGKAFLFGNTVGFAVFDIPSNTWSTAPPIFQSSSLSMANFVNQVGIRSAVQPDGYTISVLTTTPPMYMELYSHNMTIAGVAVPGFTANLHGFCMGVVPTVPPTPVVCGGSLSGGSYSDACWQFGLGPGLTPSPFATLPAAQEGCALLPFDSQFMIVPGYLATYLVTPPLSTDLNPNMSLYNMGAKTWTSVPNVQNGHSFKIQMYSSPTIIPGTSIAVLYGGENPASAVFYNGMLLFDLQALNWVSSVTSANNPFPIPLPPPTTSSATSTAPGPPSNNVTPGGDKSASNTGAIAGGVVGGVAVLAALVAFLFYKRRRPQDLHQQQYDQQQQQQQQQQYQSGAEQGFKPEPGVMIEDQTFKYGLKEDLIPTTTIVNIRRESRNPQASQSPQSSSRNPQTLL